MDNIVINVTESVEDVTIEVAESGEWLAETVSQEEAEVGTATSRRAWTAQRVKQAIDALGGGGGETLWEADGVTTIKPKLDKTVNHDKITGLGDAATKNVGTGSGDVAAGNDSRFPTTDEKAALAGTGTPSSSNKFVTENDIPSTLNKATHAEIDAGTDDIKYVTAKGIKDAKNVPSVAPGTSGNVLTSDGTDWTSATPLGSSLDINALTDKTTPADDDITVIEDSAATWAKKKLSWSNIKATLKTYFDTLYEAAIGTKGTAFNKNFGSAPGDVCEGDDSRLSDARPIEWVDVPATKTSAGTVGQAARDDKHIYVVTATNVWGRGIIAKNWPA